MSLTWLLERPPSTSRSRRRKNSKRSVRRQRSWPSSSRRRPPRLKRLPAMPAKPRRRRRKRTRLRPRCCLHSSRTRQQGRRSVSSHSTTPTIPRTTLRLWSQHGTLGGRRRGSSNPNSRRRERSGLRGALSLLCLLLMSPEPCSKSVCFYLSF